VVYITDTRAQKVVSYGVPFIKILDRFSTKTVIAAHISLSLCRDGHLCAHFSYLCTEIAISAQR